MFIYQATTQSSRNIISNKIGKVNFPKGTLLLVSLVCRIIIYKISLLQYLTPQQQKSTLSNTNI